MKRAYEGPVVTGSIRIGAQALLVAAIDTPDPAAKITDVTLPPTGWRYCGSLNDNKADVTSKKEIFSLRTGIPETIKMQEIVGVEAQIKAELNEWSVQNMWEAMGRPDVINTVTGTAATIASGTTRQVLTVGIGEVTTLGVEVGDLIVVDLEANLVSSAKVVEVFAVDNTAETISLAYALENAPANGHKVKIVTGTKFAYGDTSIVKIKAMLLFDAKDGTQICHIVPECAMTGEYSPTMTDTKKNVGLPITLDAYGVNDAEFGKLCIIKPVVFHK